MTDINPEKFWELLPIFLVKHDDNWDTQYTVMEKVLRRTLRAFAVARISHVDSTVIPSILTKNIVGIIAELAPGEDMERTAEAIEGLSFMRKYTEPSGIFLRPSYTEEGFAKEVFHLHPRYRGDYDEFYFRDYLRENPTFTSEYEALKQRLRKQCEHDRDAYTEGRATFIREWTKAARAEYAGRYY